MLQRMNELAVQASNGTNSSTDRQAIQDEISQLTTEIDRVAETTKFNESYLLKGDNAKTKNVYMEGHDAGLKGTLTDNSTSATFTVKGGDLDAGKSVTIGGKEYTIGATVDEGKKMLGTTYDGSVKAKVNGVEYTLVETANMDKDANKLDKTEMEKLIVAGATVEVGGKSATVLTDGNNDGIDDNDSSVITAAKAVELMTTELTAANNIGTVDHAATVTKGGAYDATNGVTFTITKGYATVADKLSFNLHVGSDADMTNKITVEIETMSAKNLGIKGLNVADETGLGATYAVDAIADAVQKVSEQRSALGAVQNRLEHTIANLDNVVENTTSAESRIRDTDMAETMG